MFTLNNGEINLFNMDQTRPLFAYFCSFLNSKLEFKCKFITNNYKSVICGTVKFYVIGPWLARGHFTIIVTNEELYLIRKGARYGVRLGQF